MKTYGAAIIISVEQDDDGALRAMLMKAEFFDENGDSVDHPQDKVLAHFLADKGRFKLLDVLEEIAEKAGYRVADKDDCDCEKCQARRAKTKLDGNETRH